MLTFGEVEQLVEARLGGLMLIAIDGAPLAGKSTLSERLSRRFELPILCLDDFFTGPNSWPADLPPTYPFPFFHYEEFESAVRALRDEGRAEWRPWDWEGGRIRPEPRRRRRRTAAIVEGCSVLDPRFCGLYDLRLFVASDGNTRRAAQRARDGEGDAANWETFYMPSAERYLATGPERRADHVVAGRGLAAAT